MNRIQPYSALLIIVCLLPAIGCETTPTRPKRPFDTKLVLEAIPLETELTCLIGSYYKETASDAVKKNKRDELIDKAMIIIDVHYFNFVEQFSEFKKGKDTATDISVIGVTSTAALIDPSSTTQILAAIAGGLTSANATYNKNFFYESTVPILIGSMEAERLAVRADIVGRIGEDTDVYPLQAALSDIFRYYTAGTFEGAIETIAEATALQKADTKDQFKTARDQIRQGLTEQARRTAEIRNSTYDDSTQAARVAELQDLIGQLSADEMTNKILTRIVNTRRPGKPGLDVSETIPAADYDNFMQAAAGTAPRALDPSKRDDFLRYLRNYSAANAHLVAEALVQFKNVTDAADGSR